MLKFLMKTRLKKFTENRLSGGKKRVIGKIVFSFRSKDSLELAIACGNGGLGASGSRSRPVLFKRIRESFQKACDVKMIDELNTSKT